MKEWIVRIAFAIVFAVNVTCAWQFIVEPGSYVGAYQLNGEGADAAIMGYGVVFLMWNATYPLFIYRPLKHKVLGIVILIQQAIGCIGESMIWMMLPAQGAELLRSSVERFIFFDVAGLVILLAAYLFLCWKDKSN